MTWEAIVGISLLFLSTPRLKFFYFDSGLRWQYILVFSFLASFFMTPICRWIALRFHVLDTPDWRKIHHRTTPLLGGVAVYVAFTSALLLNGIFLTGMKFLWLGATLIFILGLWDDVRPLPALLKFVLQILISLLIIIIGDLHITFFYRAPWAPLINIPITLLWIVGLTNAMNFFDGIDGLATAMSFMGALFLGILAFQTHQPALGWFAVAILGACMGFFPYNFRFGNSALLFLGDAGSTFLGFTLAGLAVLGRWSNASDFVSISAPILIFGVLIFDMIYVNLSRAKNGQAKTFFQFLTCVNKDHLHHRLIFIGFARKEVVFVISTMSACLGVSALIIVNQRFMDALLGLFQAVMIIGLIVALMWKGRDRIPKEGDRRMMRRRRDDRIEN